MHRPTIDRYILDADGNPVPEPDLRLWGAWMGVGGRQLAVDEIGEFLISTVFLGIDHQFGNGPPVLWESMVFGPEVEREIFGMSRSMRLDAGEHFDGLCQRRYASRDEALHGHAELVAEVHRIRQASAPQNGLAGDEPGNPAEDHPADEDGKPPPG